MPRLVCPRCHDLGVLERTRELLLARWCPRCGWAHARYGRRSAPARDWWTYLAADHGLTRAHLPGAPAMAIAVGLAESGLRSNGRHRRGS